MKFLILRQDLLLYIIRILKNFPWYLVLEHSHLIRRKKSGAIVMQKNIIENALKILTKEFRADLVLGALIKLQREKGESLGKISEVVSEAKKYLMEALHNKSIYSEIEKYSIEQICNFEALMNIVEDKFILDLIIRQAIFANRTAKTVVSKIGEIESKVVKIRKLVEYFFIPRSLTEIVDTWKIPREWSDETLFRKLFIEDDRISSILEKATKLILSGSNVVILGEPGVGKTSLLYRILIEISRIKNVGLIIPGNIIRNIHEELGIVLFIDDLPQQELDPQSLIKTGNLIATARIHDWRNLIRDYPEIRSKFVELELEKASDRFLRELLLRFLRQYKIDYDENVLSVVVRKALGAPMYIYQLVRDLLVKKQREGYARLDIAVAETIPEGMYEYIGELLSNTIASKNGGRSMIATLKSITLLKSKSINSLHLAMLYEEVCSILGEKPNWDLYDDIHQLMVYDTATMILKIPHDTWIDVLHGASRILKPIISLVDSKIPDKRKVEILRKTGVKSWMKIYEDIEYLAKRELITEKDLVKAINFANALKKEFPDINLFGLEEIKQLLRHRDNW